MGIVAEIWRFPVKGLGGERISFVELTRTGGLAEDRRFAIAHSESRYDPQNPQWLPKREFLQMARDDGLTPVSARWDVDQGLLTLTADFGKGASLTASPSTAEGKGLLEKFLDAHVETKRRSQSLVASKGIIFSDLGRPVVSIISRATVDAIAAIAGKPLDPARFRGNLVVMGLEPWDEMRWIDKDIQIGATRLRIFEPIGRCHATTLDPATGKSDVPIPNLIVRHFGHNKCGVYAEVMEDGAVIVGDSVG